MKETFSSIRAPLISIMMHEAFLEVVRSSKISEEAELHTYVSFLFCSLSPEGSTFIMLKRLFAF